MTTNEYAQSLVDAMPHVVQPDDEPKAGAALTREILEKGFQRMREMSEARQRYYAEGGKAFLTPTPEIYRLARECDYDLEGSFNLIHPLRMSDLEDTPLEDGIIV